MTQEEKDLLLKDLCARLPYYTELYSNVADGNWTILTPVIISNLINSDKDLVIKPYLRPMSSMTEEERNDFYCNLRPKYDGKPWESMGADVDWLNAHQFDYRGLIEKGLALEAKEGMYK
jgi:hypothetical protein